MGASNLTFWLRVLWGMIVCCLLVRMSITNPLLWILPDICQQRYVSSAKWWAKPLISTREPYKPSYQSGLQSVEISTLPQHWRGKHFDCGWIDCTPRDQPFVSDTFLTLRQQWYKLHELHFPHGHVRLFMETTECLWWQQAAYYRHATSSVCDCTSHGNVVVVRVCLTGHRAMTAYWGLEV